MIQLMHKFIINKYDDQTKYASFAFVLVAPAIIIKKGIFDNPNFSYTPAQLVIGILLGLSSMICMIILMHILSKRKHNNNLGTITEDNTTVENVENSEVKECLD